MTTDIQKRVKLLRDIRYGTRIYGEGEIGTVVQPKHLFTVRGEPFYDLYVQFGNHRPIGVLKTEVAEVSSE